MAEEKGKIALVQIAATDTSSEVILVEVTLGDEELTVVKDDTEHRITPAIRELAHQIIDLVTSEVK